jgi:hypothetical protein
VGSILLRIDTIVGTKQDGVRTRHGPVTGGGAERVGAVRCGAVRCGAVVQVLGSIKWDTLTRARGAVARCGAAQHNRKAMRRHGGGE